MDLHEIMDKCLSLAVREIRCNSDEYSELVFYKKDFDGWYALFTELFGQPVKIARVKPAKGDLQLTEKYGGIWKDQTLFKKDEKDMTLIAMFWPWQDNEHITLKMAYFKS